MDGNLSRFRPHWLLAIVSAFQIGTMPAFCINEIKNSPSIVSLAPSNTELLLDAGAGKSIVGVCTNCPQVLPKADARLKGVEIAGTFTTANLERLARLKPDVVLLVNGQEGIAALLKRQKTKVVLLHNDKLADIPGNLRQIGVLSGKKKRTEELATQFENALTQLSATIAGAKTKPKVFYCTWAQPLLTVGRSSFLNDVITACGGANIAADLAQPYPHFSAERLIISDPDVIILPYDAKDQALFKRFPWNKMRAVKENHVYYSPSPKDDMLSRPTMGVLDGLHWLTVRIHPELKEKLESWRKNFKN